MTDKIKILFLAANPVDALYRLRLDEEIREIGSKLRVGEFRNAFELVSEWAVRAGDLQEALVRHRPHIVHLSGHGSETDGIVLEDNERKMTPVDKRALARLFELLKDNIRVILLNACYAKDQAQELTKTVDYTIGMNERIGDKAAIVFAAYFYQALAFGHSVRKAFELARVQLDLEKIPGSGIPELLVREGVEQSLPFVRAESGRSTVSGKKILASVKSGAGSYFVFLCYAQSDKPWLDRLKEHLVPLRGRLKVWSDQDIESGEQWHQSITSALKDASVAVLLVSPSFLASEYIRRTEMPILLERAKKDGLLILPIVLRPSMYNEAEFLYPDPEHGPEALSLSSFLAANSPERPLSGLPEVEQDKVLLSVARRLLNLVQPGR